MQAVGSWRFVLIQCRMRVESQLDWFARVRPCTSKSRAGYVYPLHSVAQRLKGLCCDASRIEFLR